MWQTYVLPHLRWLVFSARILWRERSVEAALVMMGVPWMLIYSSYMGKCVPASVVAAWTFLLVKKLSFYHRAYFCCGFE